MRFTQPPGALAWGMARKRSLQYAGAYASAVFFFVTAIIGLPGLLDDVQGWKRWLAVLDECGTRIGLAIAGGVFLLAPSGYFRFKDWRAKKLASERRRRMSYLDACGTVAFYVQEAIKDKPDRIKLVIKKDILETFEKACPKGMKGPGVYDGDALEHWLRDSAIKMLIAHRGEVGRD